MSIAELADFLQVVDVDEGDISFLNVFYTLEIFGDRSVVPDFSDLNGLEEVRQTGDMIVVPVGDDESIDAANAAVFEEREEMRLG